MFIRTIGRRNRKTGDVRKACTHQPSATDF
jgi:hypothetical protein